MSEPIPAVITRTNLQQVFTVKIGMHEAAAQARQMHLCSKLYLLVTSSQVYQRELNQHTRTLVHCIARLVLNVLKSRHHTAVRIEKHDPPIITPSAQIFASKRETRHTWMSLPRQDDVLF